MAFEPILTRNLGKPEALTLEGYRASGGYEALAKGLKMAPEDIIEEVKESGLRGRGGAGFPAGAKWGFIPQDSDQPKYLVCNADESEPGTFKDRILIESDPHQLIEGCALCCYAVGANTCFIYIRGEYASQAELLERAIAEAHAAGLLGDNIMGSGFKLDMWVHRGAGAYICGEETGMLDSLEGKRGQPRIKPPFPALVGAFGCPTVINNVETLCNVPHIVARGGAWFKGIGTDERNSGPKLYCLSGHVEHPGVYEFPIGASFEDLLAAAGGMYHGRELKAYQPGGASAPILDADKRHLKMDFETLAEAGSMLGSAGVVVMDETTCLVRATLRLAAFFNHESCGQCTPCREGTNWVERVLQRIEEGEGRSEDLDLLLRISHNMTGTALCPLADGAVGPIASLVTSFRREVEQHVQDGTCPLPRRPFFAEATSS